MKCESQCIDLRWLIWITIVSRKLWAICGRFQVQLETRKDTICPDAPTGSSPTAQLGPTNPFDVLQRGYLPTLSILTYFRKKTHNVVQACSDINARLPFPSCAKRCRIRPETKHTILLLNWGQLGYFTNEQQFNSERTTKRCHGKMVAWTFACLRFAAEVLPKA